MKARSRSLLPLAVLLVAAAAAVAYAYYGIGRKDEAAAAKKEADAKLYLFDPLKVKAFTVEAKGDVTKLARTADGWRIEAPVKADAERPTADALVDAVARLRRKAAVADAPDAAALARYGLATPRAKVTLSVDGGKDETLALGDDNAFDGTVFVRTTSGAVELVPGDVKYRVERGTFDLREKRLLPFDEKDLARVEVTGPAGSYALVKEGDAWRLAAPVADKADPATVERVLGAIRGLRATAFAPAADVRASGLERPTWKVRLVDAKGAARALALAKPPTAKGAMPDEGLYARLEGSAEVAKVSGGAVADLEPGLAALRAKPPPPPAAEAKAATSGTK
ncbi:MAG: DUF4340 domain-containing protein [Anaeromyxobacteraceae bacterium]